MELNRFISECKKLQQPVEEAVVKTRKSKIPIYHSLSKALATLDFGDMFSTTNSKRIYVVTKASWGAKSAGKVAKGFAETTPMSQIKSYSERTKSKHGDYKSSKFKKFKGVKND